MPNGARTVVMRGRETGNKSRFFSYLFFLEVEHYKNVSCCASVQSYMEIA